MKKRTWMISALMYAIVLLACFGVLHVLKTVIAPQESTADSRRGETGEEKAGQESRESGQDKPARPRATPSRAKDPDEDDKVERETGYKGWKKQFKGVWNPPQETEEPYEPPRLILATDVHFQSASAGDGGKALQLFIERSDGKVVQYLPELLEAFIDEVIEYRPSALVLSGDITMNGEKMNHEELAQRLSRVQNAGIQVLIIPGNHDINNTDASVYFGDERSQAEGVTPQEFMDIYYDYGYEQALSRDSASLSYVYELDQKNWLLMLDSCQYEPVNKVEGRLKSETMAWADGILAQAREAGVFVLPIAHHNLLAQSRMYTTQCAMDNNGEVIDLLQAYELPLYFSGHLHVQRMRRHKSEPGVPDEAYGIHEIVTDALSIPPCQYGKVTWEEDGSIQYATMAVDVSAWAKRTGSENPDLLDFEDWSSRYIQKLISDQIRGVIKNLGDDVERSMAAVYAGVYIDYYAGRKIDAEGVRSTKGYRWWQRNLPDSYLIRELDSMLTDSVRDNNYFLLPEEDGWFTDETGE